MADKYRILGAGEWGIAIGNHLARLGNKVEIFGREGEIFDKLKETRSFDKLNLSLHHNIIRIENLSTLKDFENDCINILSTSSSGFSNLVKNNQSYLKLFTSIVWLTKGIDNQSGELFDKIITKQIGSDKSMCLVSGPSFAIDLVNKKPQRVSIASTSNQLLSEIKNSMSSEHFEMVASDDLIGIQVSGIIKNVSAIIAGAMSSIGFSKNDILALIKISQEEVKNLTKSIYIDRGFAVPSDEIDKTICSPSCLGDLELTCLSDKSRNRQFGFKFAEGIDIKDLLKEFVTVEGYVCTEILIRKYKTSNCKVINAAYKIFYLKEDISKTIKRLLS